MTTTTRRSWRLTRLAAVGAVAVTLLSACISVKADLTVNPDATASGTFALELEKEAAGFLGITSLDTFAEGIDSGDVSGGTGLEQFQTCTPSETDAAFVYSCSFENAAFTADDGPWTIAKDGDQITFRMQSAADEEAAGTEELLGDASVGEIEVKVAFPGPISSITGSGAEQTSDTTATISGSLTDQLEVTIVSAAGGGGALSSLLVLLIFAAIVILIIVVVVVLIMRRRGGGSELDAETVAAAEAIAPEPDAVPLTPEELADLEAPTTEEAATVVEEAAVEEAAAEETPVAEEAVVEETAAVEEAAVDEAAVDEAAVAEAPVVEEAVIEEAAVVDAPVVEEAAVVEEAVVEADDTDERPPAPPVG